MGRSYGPPGESGAMPLHPSSTSEFTSESVMPEKVRPPATGTAGGVGVVSGAVTVGGVGQAIGARVRRGLVGT